MFVLNNVDNNDTIVRYVLNEFKLHDTYEKKYCQLYYLDYIINLIVQDFIFDQNLKKWLQEHTIIKDSIDIKDL